VRRYLLLISLILLSACQPGTRAPIPDTGAAARAAESVANVAPVSVRKSPNDNRDYRYITLANGLRVLLVSDPTTDKAAASLVVFRGSHHEPAEYPGLAHFLEHMLFIGTEKYPDIDAYQQFIGQHGGSSNAYTAGDHTNYFFDIKPGEFRPALDRFAQFFIAPLLAADYVEREKNAVHSEYQMQLKADGWRANAVLGTAVSPEHPESRFNIGSLETLGAGVDEALRTFMLENYSADAMALVALSNEPLDTLEAWITPLFGAIPNRNIGAAPEPPPLFQPGQLPAELTFASIKDGYSVSYNFPVPASPAWYRTKPGDYLSNLLGHEGTGSLHQLLRGRGYLESLSAGTFDVDSRNGLLSIEIELTEAGYRALPTVSDLVFDWIELQRQEGPSAWRHAEQAALAELAFRFEEKSSPTGFVYRVAPALMRYPAADVLVAPYLMPEFNANAITRFMDALRPDNVLVTVSGPDVETSAEEQWFKVPYTLERTTIERKAESAALALPERNPFIPERLDLVADAPAGPVLGTRSKGLQLWVDEDTEFGTPRANLRLSLGLHGGIASAEDRALAMLHVALVEDALGAEVYPAILAGLGYGLSVDGAGIVLDIRGYDDRQSVLLERVLTGLRDPGLNPDRFAIVKERLTRVWNNFREERPFTQAASALSYLLLSDQWPPELLAATLADAQPADLERWRQTRLKTFNVVGLVHGNIRGEELAQLPKILSRRLTLDEFPRAAPVVRDVDRRTRYPLSVDHNDAAIVMYVQDSASSLAQRARTALTAAVIRQAYFTALRTEQQLGYVVAANNQTLRDRGGLVFVVQSPVASTAEIERRTREFLAQQKALVDSLSNDSFEAFRAGLIAQLLERDRNLAQRSDRLWRDLDLGFTDFDSREQIAAIVRTLTREDIAAAIAETLSDFDRRVLLTYAPGQFEAVPQGGARIRDVAAWKQSN
jgi:insulysin